MRHMIKIGFDKNQETIKNMQKITKHELLGHLMYHDNRLVGFMNNFCFLFLRNWKFC